MVGLTAVPPEIIAEITEQLDLELRALESLPRNDLLNLALASKSFFEIITPILHRSFLYNRFQDPHGRILPNYIRLLRKKPELAQHLRVVVMHNLGVCSEQNIRVWHNLKEYTNGKIYSARTVGSFIVAKAVRLKSLKIEYPDDGDFLNFRSETIEELHVRPTSEIAVSLDHPPRQFAGADPLDGLLPVEFLPHVLCWPKLKILCLEATQTSSGVDLPESEHSIPLGTSPLTDIVLRLGEVDEEAISMILQVPRALVSFIYWPPGSGTDWDPDRLPKTSMISAALQPHAPTLRHLALRRADFHWKEKFDLFGSLSHFCALKSLEIDATMLLGWTHCDCVRSGSTRRKLAPKPADPLTLASMLPPSIEKATIRIDRHPADLDLAKFVRLIVEGIALDVKEGRLGRLKKLHIEPNQCSYCQRCDGHDQELEFVLSIGLPSAPVVRIRGALHKILATSGCTLTLGK